MAESRRQADEFGTDHFQLYENWDKILTKKNCQKPNCTKTGAYENRGLSVCVYIKQVYLILIIYT